MKARKMSHSGSRKLFKKTASRPHPKNNMGAAKGLKRGGYRL